MTATTHNTIPMGIDETAGKPVSALLLPPNCTIYETSTTVYIVYRTNPSNKVTAINPAVAMEVACAAGMLGVIDGHPEVHTMNL